MANGDQLPYFQRLRVGSKLNNEVTIHHVTESKFYKGQEPSHPDCLQADESMFSRHPWSDSMHPQTAQNTGESPHLTRESRDIIHLYR
ncbi:hypothetical protein O3G_MSEX015358 [Manduca sexta]|uniref:Uncharacterized protein n=1 Tax=Manduca sexta TaxID=7130 RepID=A0A922A1T4_MANSE|nr:hypothetical protein O3G_MSEX015358 [Manduca sexta]